MKEQIESFQESTGILQAFLEDSSQIYSPTIDSFLGNKNQKTAYAAADALVTHIWNHLGPNSESNGYKSLKKLSQDLEKAIE